MDIKHNSSKQDFLRASHAPCGSSLCFPRLSTRSTTTCKVRSRSNHLVLLDHLRQLVGLGDVVYLVSAHHLISNTGEMVSKIEPGKQNSPLNKAYREVSWKVSIFALHLKLRLVQLASSNAAANLVSSSSFIAISSSADLPPMMVLPTSSKQLSHNWPV